MNPSEETTVDPLQKAFEPTRSRFIIGIDLGTTNCAVAFIDTAEAKPSVQIFRVEQMIDANTTESCDTLPSFHYEILSSERTGIDGRFQFNHAQHCGIVGTMARDRGVEIPGRGIASAKSWLCHSMVDRTSDLLPWGSDENVLKLSPVEASRRYLEHIRRCWDRRFPDFPMREQDTVVTLPASFDEVARRLTIEAATRAGIENLILIEEPQAAFYSWLERNADHWTQHLRAGQSILVCDIGGGTTDFTLIRVIQGSASGPLSVGNHGMDASESVSQTMQAAYGLHRVAVGEHLMLGGDNLDLALAKAIEHRLLADNPGQERLRPRQWDALKLQCRAAKETLLGPRPPDSYSLSIPERGAKLIEKSKSITVERSWVHELLVEGFFGKVPIDARPIPQEEGFQEFGLPYASEPNVLKHLAAFLWDHRYDGRSNAEHDLDDLTAARPDWLLFNGGVLESPQIKQSIVDQIGQWFAPLEASWTPGILQGNRLDLAVAQGAAYFGWVRRGDGVKINATLAKTYYVQVSQSPELAMCVMPANAHPGEQFRQTEHTLSLTVGQPVQFPVFVSSTRLVHESGQLVPVDLQYMTPMPPLQTVLELPNRKSRSQILVTMASELSEIGTLQLSLREVKPSEESRENLSWRLEFDARGASNRRSTSGPTLDESTLAQAVQAVDHAFASSTEIAPKDCIDYLTKTIGRGRRAWEPPLLRSMWSALMDRDDYRKLSPDHEARWLNLLGWCLRPGFGSPADDWRVHATWRNVHNKLVHRTTAGLSETIVLWRRIAGGFTPGQQQALFQDVWPKLKSMYVGGSGLASNPNVTIELIRLVGALEWLSQKEKQTIMDVFLQSLGKKKFDPFAHAALWALGRLGTRVPVYANLEGILPAERIQTSLDRICQLKPEWLERNAGSVIFCLTQWGRKTDDRYRDLGDATRGRILSLLEQLNAPSHSVKLVCERRSLSEEEASILIGDSLPLGFSLAV